MKEALKTALEAIERILESTIPYTELGTPTLADSAVKLATDALHYGKAALEQPEQEPVAWEQFYPDIGKPQLRARGNT